MSRLVLLRHTLGGPSHVCLSSSSSQPDTGDTLAVPSLRGWHDVWKQTPTGDKQSVKSHTTRQALPSPTYKAQTAAPIRGDRLVLCTTQQHCVDRSVPCGGCSSVQSHTYSMLYRQRKHDPPATNKTRARTLELPQTTYIPHHP